MAPTRIKELTLEATREYGAIEDAIQDVNTGIAYFGGPARFVARTNDPNDRPVEFYMHPSEAELGMPEFQHHSCANERVVSQMRDAMSDAGFRITNQKSHVGDVTRYIASPKSLTTEQQTEAIRQFISNGLQGAAKSLRNNYSSEKYAVRITDTQPPKLTHQAQLNGSLSMRHLGNHLPSDDIQSVQDFLEQLEQGFVKNRAWDLYQR